MSLPRRTALLLTVTAAFVAGPACAGDPVVAPPDTLVPPQMDAAVDQTMVIVRDVNPRIAYRGPADTTDNPARVTATVFPTRVFNRALDGMMVSLVGDASLGDTAPTAIGAQPDPARFASDMPELRDGRPLGAGGGSTPMGSSGAMGSIGGAVMSATFGIADTITTATMRASAIGAGP
ncbi:hypothetical protein [Lysobacter sp. HA18]